MLLECFDNIDDEIWDMCCKDLSKNTAIKSVEYWVYNLMKVIYERSYDKVTFLNLIEGLNEQGLIKPLTVALKRLIDIIDEARNQGHPETVLKKMLDINQPEWITQ